MLLLPRERNLDSMVHSEWIDYRSGDIEPGDIVCLGVRVGSVVLNKCPVCYSYLDKTEGDKTCSVCGTMFDKVSRGHLIYNIPKEVHRGIVVHSHVG
jgi:hypothetical protein